MDWHYQGLIRKLLLLLRLITEEEASYSLSIPRSMSSVWFIIELYLGSFFKTSWVFLTASAHPFSQCVHWSFILLVFWLHSMRKRRDCECNFVFHFK